MTVQLPALAFRASFIATIAAVLIAAMVYHGPGRGGQRARHAACSRRAPVWARSPVPKSVRCSGRCERLRLRHRRAGRRRSLRSADCGCRPAAAGARGLAVDGLVGERTRTALHLPRRAPPPARAALATPAHGRRRAPRAGRSRRSPPSLRTRRARTPSPPSAPTTVRPTPSPRSCSGALRGLRGARPRRGLGRRVSRARSSRGIGRDARRPRPRSWGSADGADNRFPPSPVAQREPR